LIGNNASSTPHTESVYALHGSAFLLRRECVVSLMKLESLPFMYGEELFVAETVFKNKMRMVLDCDYILYHNENQVTGKIPSKQKQKWFSDSIKTINRLFYS
jgi:GT2 family glycosyltransferase